MASFLLFFFFCALPWSDTIAGALLLLLSAWGVVDRTQNKSWALLPWRWMAPLWVSLLLVLLSAFRDEGWSAVWIRWPFLFGFVAFSLVPPETFRKTLLYGVLVSGGLIFVRFLTTLPSVDWTLSRAFHGVAHQHVYIALYAFAGLAILPTTRLRLAGKAAIGFFLLTLAWLGGSKMALLALGFGVVSLIVNTPSWRPYRLRLLLGGGVLATLLFFGLIQQTDGKFKRERWLHPQPQWATGSIETRSVLWQSTLRIVAQENWVLGVGQNAKNSLRKQEFDRMGFWFGSKRSLNSHNLLLEYLLGYGALGVSLVFAAVVWAWGKRPRGWIPMTLLLVLGLIAGTESLTERAFGAQLVLLYWWLAWMQRSPAEEEKGSVVG